MTMTPAFSSRDYLKAAVRQELSQVPACFELLVQQRPRDDERAFPVEDASVIWSEEDAPFVRVARLDLPRQNIDDLSATCDALRFNPWHALVDHRPLGNLNRSRRALYSALATYRAQHSASSPSSPTP